MKVNQPLTNPKGSVLVIGAVDPTGLAGIAQDIRTLKSINLLASPIITALTAQNSLETPSVFPTSLKVFIAQLKSVFTGLKITSVKTGAFINKGLVNAFIHELFLAKLKVPIVVDPVIKSSNGGVLFPMDQLKSLIELIKIAKVVTPNLEELALLTNIDNYNKSSILKGAQMLCELGAHAVVIKGGHSKKQIIVDYLYLESGQYYEYGHEKLDTKNNRGSGCAFASALAGYLSLGLDLEAAYLKAVKLTEMRLKNSSALNIAKGNGPII